MSKPQLLLARGNILLCLLVMGVIDHAAHAGEKQAPARCREACGVLLQHEKTGTWTPIKPGDALPLDVPILALPEAEIQSGNNKVLVKMVCDVGKRGPFPVLESAMRLHAANNVDMDVTLERGIIGFANLQKEGSARVKLRFLDQAWDLMVEPGTRIGIEIYGRHPPGIPAFLDKNVKDSPTIDVVFLVLSGRVLVGAQGQEFAMTAPPGPASLRWNNLDKQIEVARLEKLPENITGSVTKEETEKRQFICRTLKRFAAEPIENVLANLVQGDNERERRLGVICLGALDKLPELLKSLTDPKHADVRDQSILVLRSWLGRGEGQALRLYNDVMKPRQITLIQAKNIFHLLFGFTDEEKLDPITYQVLIDCLKHSKLPVRELARWHLVRLAPEGKNIAYDAAGPEDQRMEAYRQWQALVPPGKLPPRLRKAGNGNANP
jgi:hypothetical protein